MNYLAHVYFSYENEDLLIGNILTDILSIKELRLLDKKYEEGIRLHRIIDTETDSHPVHKKNLSLLYDCQGKYSPVVMDIFYDYLLAKNWVQLTGISQRKICDQTYKMMLNHQGFIPERAAMMFGRMVEDDFLFSCNNYQRLEKTFERLLKRVKFPSKLDRAVDDLKRLETAFEADFSDFFKDMENVIKGFRFT
ncbi:MAG: DUF479 domain-containing protein [Saprospiraceae bacterium]|nr:DUF479 domain-containing protein [Saprospiraceae bacterium]